MLGLNRLTILAAAVAATGWVGAASASTTTTYCPAPANSTDSVRNFYVTIDNTNGAAGCEAYGPGNTTNNPAIDAVIGSADLLDKTDSVGSSGVVITVTGSDSGTWDIFVPDGYELTNAFISFKSGEGGGDPDWALFSLPDGVLSGAWGFDDTQCSNTSGPPRPEGCNGTQSLSHAEVYGTLVPSQVPLPAAGLLLVGGLGALGAAAKRRRKAA